jgi:uncharacterized protein with PIN domain
LRGTTTLRRDDSDIEPGGTPRNAVIRFHGRLNDFLPHDSPQFLPYTFRNTPTVKHAVEAVGPPHPEVGRILVRGSEVGFSHQLQQDDEIEVFPVSGDWLYVDSPLRSRYRGRPKFVLDVHLGTLARRLRLLGFDSLYSNRFRDDDIARAASTEERIVLTRDIGMLMWCDVQYGSWVRSQDPAQQVVEVLEHYHLRSRIRPFHRCTVCNGRIDRIDLGTARREVKPEIFEYYHEFYRCRSCRRIYWKGTHFRRMERFIASYTGSFD